MHALDGSTNQLTSAAKTSCREHASVALAQRPAALRCATPLRSSAIRKRTTPTVCMRRFVNVTQGLAITSLVLPVIVLGYAVRRELIAVAIALPLTIVFWTLTAAQMRANLNERGGYWTDPQIRGDRASTAALRSPIGA